MRLMSSEKPPGRGARIVESVIGLIEGGTFKTGERLPAIRIAAENFGVSKNTMADAYDRLVSLGYLEARRGSGYYVRPIRLKPNALWAAIASTPHATRRTRGKPGSSRRAGAFGAARSPGAWRTGSD